MTQRPPLVAVTPASHQNKNWRGADNFHFAASWTLQPVVLSELSMVAAVFPVAILQRGDTLDLVAINSGQSGLNLAVAPDGRWLANYVPALVRAHPFVMARPQGMADEILCVDEATGFVQDGAPPEGSKQRPFFGSDGKPSPALVAVADFLRQIHQSRVATREACRALRAAGVTKPLEITPKSADGSPVQAPALENLWMVDRKAFDALPDDAFLALRQNQGLPLAYVQIASMSRFPVLEQMARLRQQWLARAASGNAVPQGAAQDGVLKFT